MLEEQKKRWWFYGTTRQFKSMKSFRADCGSRAFLPCAVSENRLPKREEGQCVLFNGAFLQETLKNGKRLKIAIGDPRFIDVMYVEKGYSLMPQKLQEMMGLVSYNCVWHTFRLYKKYGGGLLFARDSQVCLAKDVRIEK